VSKTGTARRYGEYNDRVRRYFASPAHGGGLPAGSGSRLAAVVEEGGAGARLALEAVVENGSVQQLRYRVFGCPHLIAAAEAVAERLEGGPAEALATVPVDEFMEQLEVPVEKTGRILLLEDACLAIARKYAQALEKKGQRT
jgi:NifU-like protein involved in Fe-S cluster formation